MHRFSFYRRNQIYYVRFYNPDTKKYSSGKSTGETEKQAALAKVAFWDIYGIDEGIEQRSPSDIIAVDTIIQKIKDTTFTKNDIERVISIFKNKGLLENASLVTDGPENENLLHFLTIFWNYEKSPYIKEKLRYGHSIGKRHCHDMNGRLPHWKEFFQENRLKDITKQRLKDFQEYLSTKQLAPKTKNIIMDAGLIPLKWAYDEKIIKKYPGEGLRRFSGTPTKRGILTPKEVKALFSKPWRNNMSRVANLIACTTGMRAGEIAALRLEDIGEDRIHVRHSYSFADGLKAPKNGETREVPLLPAIRVEILDLLQSSPWGDDGFIFYSVDHDKPIYIDTFRKSLNEELKNLVEISNTERKERGLCFHSWRHYFAANIADKLNMRTVQLATGHKTQAMAEHYANHKNEAQLKEISEVAAGAFGNIISFSKEAEA